jgi:hypothetical protein
MNGVRRARASFCASAFVLSSCWLVQYGDLSSEFGDAGTRADAGAAVDAGVALDGGPPFCPPDAGPLAYCMDFDGVGTAALNPVVNGANVTIVNGPYVSPPSSLLVDLQGAASFGRYDVSFPFQPTTARLEFEIQTVGLVEGVTTLAITLLDPATQTTRRLNVVVAPHASFEVQEYFALPDGGAAIGAHPFFQVDAGQAPAWHHVVLTLTVNDASKQYASGLTVDGQVLEDGQPLTLAPERRRYVRRKRRAGLLLRQRARRFHALSRRGARYRVSSPDGTVGRVRTSQLATPVARRATYPTMSPTRISRRAEATCEGSHEGAHVARR